MLILAAALMAMAAPAQAAPSPCTIDISIEGTEFVAPVNSTMPGAVTMQGSYTGTKPSFERAVVTLTGTVSTGWPISISPATTTISANVGPSGSFTVVVVVPAATLHADVGMVTIVATMTAGGLQCRDTAGGISVTPAAYLDDVIFRIDPEELKLTGDIGSFELYVEAKANVAVTVNIAFQNSPGISIIAPSSISIPAPTGAPMNQTVTVRVSASNPVAPRNPISGFLNATAEGGLRHSATVQSSVNVQLTACDCGPGVSWVPLAVSVAAVGAVAVTGLWLHRHGRR